MAYKTAAIVPLSGNVWIDGLTDGYRWGVTPDDPAVGFTFISDTSGEPDGQFGGYPSWGWSDRERSRMQEAMDAIAFVSGLRFDDRGDDNDENVEIWFYNLDDRDADDTYGYAYTPGSDPDEGLVAVNWSPYQTDDGAFKASIASGSFYGITFLHELCHAVGLKHPHDKGLNGQLRFPGLTRKSNEFRDKGDFDQNAHPFTQLSYVDKGARNGYVPRKIEDFGFLLTPGALDIAALQWLYGVNRLAANGDNVYRLPVENKEGTGWQAIWDSGGRDRITAAGAVDPVTIDLRNATLGLDDHAGGYISRVDGILGGFTIAHDWDGFNVGQPAGLCVIEVAVGGSGGDRLIGNDFDNRIKGKKGPDVIYAGGGSGNRVTGGKGRDQFWIDSGTRSFVEITDFDARRDLIVLDVDPSTVTLLPAGDSIDVLLQGAVVARLDGITQLDPDRNLLFSSFEGL